MITKGVNQHVIPYEDVWAVYEAGNADILLSFPSREEAVAYAQSRATLAEGGVLIHECAPGDAGQVATLKFMDELTVI